VKHAEIRDAARIDGHDFSIQDKLPRLDLPERVGDRTEAVGPVMASAGIDCSFSAL
jgi:hypothetical protein